MAPVQDDPADSSAVDELISLLDDWGPQVIELTASEDSDDSDDDESKAEMEAVAHVE
jgi:hypothetical protein